MELSEQFLLHVVCEWLGNSTMVAEKHYLKAREEDFERAGGSAENSALYAEKVAQKAMHHGDTLHRNTIKQKTPRKLGAFAFRWFSVCHRVLIYPQGDSNPCLLAENQTS